MIDLSAAACRGLDTELFYGPEKEGRLARSAREKKARKVCAGCLSRAACLDYALSRPEKHGMWGGLNEKQRIKEKRRRVRSAAKAAAGVA